MQNPEGGIINDLIADGVEYVIANHKIQIENCNIL